MSDFIQGVTAGGQPFTPKFVVDLNQKACIGCGRCYKVCSRGVLEMVGITEDGDVVDAQDDEAEKKVMQLKAPEACIGCEACAKVCGKNCYTHAPKKAA